MLKQSASRNQRYKGFKVKHVLQICVLLALCIWLLNQVKNNYEKNGSGILQEAAMKLGRKDLDPQVQRSSNENEDVEGEEEVEEIKAEETEDDGRGGGDDEIDGRNREKAEEEVEDLIDEEDRDKENQIEDLSLLEEQTMMTDGEEILQDPREEQDMKHDASTTLMQNEIDTTGIAQMRRLTSVA
ncbi:hypothetical protein CCACVL1_30176 [Corchorus capsularis]|uniref:Uncharacterized protein n=1 Tax=Corchorus capsularis TaxID=210143 RepID=A0A1R3FYG5_COCAP|nr:hypothetical protein CCACVL1_30176 [Corchorus capsularis]